MKTATLITILISISFLTSCDEHHTNYDYYDVVVEQKTFTPSVKKKIHTPPGPPKFWWVLSNADIHDMSELVENGWLVFDINDHQLKSSIHKIWHPNHFKWFNEWVGTYKIDVRKTYVLKRIEQHRCHTHRTYYIPPATNHPDDQGNWGSWECEETPISSGPTTPSE